MSAVLSWAGGCLEAAGSSTSLQGSRCALRLSSSRCCSLGPLNNRRRALLGRHSELGL